MDYVIEFYRSLLELLQNELFDSDLAIKLIKIRSMTARGISLPDVTYEHLKFWHEHAGAIVVLPATRPDMVQRELITKHTFRDLSGHMANPAAQTIFSRWRQFSDMEKDVFVHLRSLKKIGGDHQAVTLVTAGDISIEEGSKPIRRTDPDAGYFHLSVAR